MVGRIVLVCVTAFVMYVIVPEAGFFIAERWRARQLSFLKKSRGIPGICTGFAGRKLIIRIDPVQATPEAGAATEFPLNPAKTRFALLRKTGEIEWLNWQTVRMIQKGATVSVIAGERKKKGYCLFHEEISERDLALRIESLKNQDMLIRNPIKVYAVGAGAFIEFILFLDSLRFPEMSTISVFALVAIFGKALPYCPPGLILTTAAHALSGGKNGRKKSRGRSATGFLLLATGVALNIAVIFFVIRQIGFPLP